MKKKNKALDVNLLFQRGCLGREMNSMDSLLITLVSSVKEEITVSIKNSRALGFREMQKAKTSY